jgi:hypothetical protein
MVRKSRFVNGNRTNAERRVRYCFLRNVIGFTRNEARIIVAYRDKNQIRSIKQFDIEI